MFNEKYVHICTCQIDGHEQTFFYKNSFWDSKSCIYIKELKD